MKEAQIKNYKKITELLTQYEETNLVTYMDYKHNNLVMADPDRAEMKEKVVALSDSLRNPY